MLKIAIIGSGFGRYGLLPAFASIPRCKVVAICGKKTKAMADDCKRFGVMNIYSDWRALLENEKLDAVALAVTPRAQYEIGKAAIKKGLHVFAEKPLAATAAQARELLALAKRKKVVHSVDFIFPEIAAWKKAKEMLDKNTYGELRHLSVDWDFLSYDIEHKRSTWKTDSKEGGGALSFFFSHGLYYLEHFAGKISKVKSNFTYSKESLGGGEVGVDMLLTFENQSTGHVHLSCNTRGLRKHELIFRCARGTMVLGNTHGYVDDFTLTVYDEKGARRVKVPAEKKAKNEDARVAVLRKLAARFVNSCTRGVDMHPGFAEGVRVQELIAEIRAQSTSAKPRARTS
ncbi:hypothetical protein A3A38_00080 [Candidatus Kaiserbacteria bacterium RIFCSPLOWO2_01_FULL_53_17]|uniref:Gfo/Idh/MocA-like oxidoreductase N-terminal domain-containing protein n=1 Tax=Candidatus Kaiserbacteria bacterium RIFCSPLOWO2_01_FULL_53_17 TaxID=1798511 RepID=A0A1F6EG63_9BACT|nr:MAG: hypothetical protein A3A38_00080 [Candidatus Kaiserbacteria bacterium RIFCSPLOWO2_01_FULL_53_17]